MLRTETMITFSKARVAKEETHDKLGRKFVFVESEMMDKISETKDMEKDNV